MPVYSIFVEKKPAFATKANALWKELKEALQPKTITGVQIIHRYLVEGVTMDQFQSAIGQVFSRPQVDEAYMGLPRNTAPTVFGVELLPSQFDQRADSCAQNLALLTGEERPLVRYTTLYALEGNVSAEELAAVKEYLINPVEKREVSLEIPTTLVHLHPAPKKTPRLEGFTGMNREDLAELRESYGIAMDLDDLVFCWDYFTNTEKRNPTETEIRMIDTYWSDHCRHTTFFTELEELTVEDPEIAKSKERYFALRDKLYADKYRPPTLMDLATIGARALKAEGILTDLDESEEVNACTVKITVDVDGEDQDWLLLFKNETHNHPTEIEPFGGAATCLGGAIRDPLSGRGYVYQAMRITGAANPLAPVSETIEGKLPQRSLVTTAADGYSSYGNQIGVATGHVQELYHDGYLAKRMELGAVVAAVPEDFVVREVPAPGDAVILLGGKTGKDGVGGATGSSQSHTVESAEESGAEVQKGNAPEERKIQRMFRDPEVTRMIKRCNDFGAGGVSVSIGELADGVRINLDMVPTKFEGLSGTEVAISESQERMSVVVAPEDADRFIQLAEQENLEATVVAEITEEKRLVMHWQGDTIVDIAREFLDSNGTDKFAKAHISSVAPWVENLPKEATGEDIKELLADISHCSQHGLLERFDSTAGGNTVLPLYTGSYQLTPSQAMVAKIPLTQGKTNTASVMAWGFDPELSSHSPYHGSKLAVIDSVSKMIAAGGSLRKSWLTFQEYFERLENDPERWGKPAAALLGALDAQLALEIGAVGGKDSMSGSFEDLHVPPTLVSFAVSVAKADKVVSGDFKNTGSPVYHLTPEYEDNGLVPTFDSLKDRYQIVEELLVQGKVEAIYTVGTGGTAKAIPMMCFGNHIGLVAEKALSARPQFGSFILETTEEIEELAGYRFGTTAKEYTLTLPTEEVSLDTLEAAWLDTLTPIFPTETKLQGDNIVETYTYDITKTATASYTVDSPVVLVPVLPGASGEYELTKRFEEKGATVEVFLFKNLTKDDVTASFRAFANKLKTAHILALPSGMTGGGEPDGSGKFLAALLNNPLVKEEVTDLVQNREGLVCGIGEGFHALLQTGLLPYGEYRGQDESSPMLTDNKIGRFQSALVRTRISSNLSPWLADYKVGEVFLAPFASGDGCFTLRQSELDSLARNGQIASQYVSLAGEPSMDIRYNPAGSMDAVEAITSPDGRILGCMTYPERTGADLYKGVAKGKRPDVFSGAVRYFTK